MFRILTFLISFYFLSSSVFAAEPVFMPHDELLDKIQRTGLEYFIQESEPKTGLVYDHAGNFTDLIQPRSASIAATGFGLSAYVVGVDRNWMDRDEAKRRTLTALDFFLNQAETEHGFFYHFLNAKTGVRIKDSELSPIDSTLLVSGMLFAAEYFEAPEIREKAEKIFERMDWTWLLHGGKTFALAWSPENGFQKARWDKFDESILMYLWAMGSASFPVSEDSWRAIQRPVGSYKGHRLIQMPPLFTHQYPHIWVDFRNKHDAYADYFENSVQASLANRQFVMDRPATFNTQKKELWGLTASNGPFGYRAYGASPGWAQYDGTLAPTGCISSMPFVPEMSMACAQTLYENFRDKLWGRYGFSDSYHLQKNWFDDKVLAIDQGAMVLMIENHRSGLIWKTMEKNQTLARGLKKAGFQPGVLTLPWPEPPTLQASFMFTGIVPDGYLKDWPNANSVFLNAANKEHGLITDETDLSAQVRFAWDADALYFAVKVTDESLVLKRHGKNIWLDDCFELYVDPQADGLFWKEASDYQIGFHPNSRTEDVGVWSWFQDEDPSAVGMIQARGNAYAGGYLIEGAIRWKYLGIQPYPGLAVKISAAVHDVDLDKSEAKIQWFFRNEEEENRFNLGTVVLGEPSSLKKAG